jgi:hypothetical protein
MTDDCIMIVLRDFLPETIETIRFELRVIILTLINSSFIGVASFVFFVLACSGLTKQQSLQCFESLMEFLFAMTML